MTHKFTPEQIARQERWKREEQFKQAAFIINCLMAIPFLHLLLPGLLPVISFVVNGFASGVFAIASTAMTLADTGLTAERNKVLAADQKALNESKKKILLKKKEVLSELEKLPINVKGNFSKTASKKHIDTSLIKPTNIILGALNKNIADKPLNLPHIHKR